MQQKNLKYLQKSSREKKEKEIIIESTKSFERRRLEMRAKRKQNDTSTESREEDTFNSEILAPMSVPELLNIPNGDYLFIATDVDTSRENDCDLVQVSAALSTSHFDAYVIPRRQITLSASRVTGLTVAGSQLLLHGKPFQM